MSLAAKPVGPAKTTTLMAAPARPAPWVPARSPDHRLCLRAPAPRRERPKGPSPPGRGRPRPPGSIPRCGQTLEQEPLHLAPPRRCRLDRAEGAFRPRSWPPAAAAPDPAQFKPPAWGNGELVRGAQVVARADDVAGAYLHRFEQAPCAAPSPPRVAGGAQARHGTDGSRRPPAAQKRRGTPRSLVASTSPTRSPWPPAAPSNERQALDHSKPVRRDAAGRHVPPWSL